MRTADLAGYAVEALRLHRMRTALSVAAVGVGAAAILVLTSLGDAAKRYVNEQFASVGTDLLVVVPGRTETSGLTGGVGGNVHPLTLDDAEAIRLRVPGVLRVAPVSVGTAPVSAGSRSRDVYVVGATRSYGELRDLQPAVGRLLPEGDLARGGRELVLGDRLRRELFGGANPVGTWVRVGEERFHVIGVAQPLGRTLGMDFDDMAIVPVATGLRMFGQVGLHRLMVQCRSPDALPRISHDIRAVLSDRHRDEDFTVISPDALLASFRSVLQALTVALAGIAAISLAVAGIGIMNVMLVSVSERVREIGLLKALGAPPARIAALFVAEAVLLSLLGALAGLLAGAVLVGVAQTIWRQIPFGIDLRWPLVVVALSVTVGAVFGFLPARRASLLSATDALRGRR